MYSAQVMSRGFTLIELVMSLFIVGLVTGVVVWTLPGDNSAAHDEARWFAARLNFAKDESVLSGESMGVVLGIQSYAFYRYRRGAWELINDISQLQPRMLEGNVQFNAGIETLPNVALERSDVALVQTPIVVFSPIGAHPKLSFLITDGTQKVSVESTRFGDIEVKHGSAS